MPDETDSTDPNEDGDRLRPSVTPAVWTASPKRPILDFLIVIVLIAAYGVVLQVGTRWSHTAGTEPLLTGSTVAVLGGYFAVLVLIGVLAQAAATIGLVDTEAGDPPSTATLRHLGPPLVLVLHVGWYSLLTGPLLARPGLLFIAFIEGIVLALVIGKANAPVRPARLDRIADANRVEFLEIDMANFWRWTQIAMSFLFAFGIGIAAAAPSLGSPDAAVDLTDIVLHSILSAIGLLALSVYVLWKMNDMRETVANDLSDPD